MGTLALGEEPLCGRLKFPAHLPGRQKEIRQQITGNRVAFPAAALPSEPQEPASLPSPRVST